MGAAPAPGMGHLPGSGPGQSMGLRVGPAQQGAWSGRPEAQQGLQLRLHPAPRWSLIRKQLPLGQGSALASPRRVREPGPTITNRTGPSLAVSWAQQSGEPPGAQGRSQGWCLGIGA